MSKDWSHISVSSLYFDKRHQREHEAWLRRGRTGQGRFLVEGENLREARASMILTAARIVDCDLGDSILNGCFFDEAELQRCSFADAKLFLTCFDRVSIEEGDFQRADLRLSRFKDCRIRGGTWNEAFLERASFSDAQIENVAFANVQAVDSKWDRATIRECQFLCADLSHKEKGLILGCAHGTRFERCDFRGASLDGFRLKDTVFDQCAFYGVMGKPELQGDVTLIDPDVSEAYDGTSIVSARDLLARWSD